ncbi:hypothetical protein FSARC_2541 [Fusarium sarcochroum]|uniref:Major facilitator superfamily (MFS) profile domain-containing protein n=1 Tax=Fusarium sarcochroum TaxID=1208366 RepID=A0A8H4U5X6_9HYPO|nr:hypothetical protein FSARC_2541 [Fusarium sarcochroum]
MSLPEKSPESLGDAPHLPQPATTARPATPENDGTTVVDIESSFAAWTCVLGSFLFLMPTFGMMQSVGTFQSYLELNQLRDYSAGDVGWIPGMYMFLSMLVAIQVGPVLDQRGPFALSIIGGGGVVAMFIIVAECKTYWQFMLCFGIFGGLATAIAGTIGVTVVAKLFSRRRGLAIGLALTGSSIGTVIFPIMLRSLLPKLGWSWSMRILAFVVLGIFIVGTICLVPYRRLAKLTALPVTKKRGLAVLNFSAFRSVPFSLVSVMHFAIQYVLYGIGGLLPTFAIQAGLTPETGYTLLSIIGGASAFGRVIPGMVGDKLGHYNVLICMMALTLIFMGTLFVPFGNNSVVLYVFTGLWGFCSGGFLSITPVCVGKTCEPKDYGRYYGTLNFIISFSLLISIPTSGAMIEKMGTHALSGLLAGFREQTPTSGTRDTHIHVVQSLSVKTDDRRNRWLWDTGANIRTVNNAQWFDQGNWKPLERDFPITTGGGIIYPTGIGKAKIQVMIDKKFVDVELKATLLIESFPLNIFSGERTYHGGGYLVKNDIFDSRDPKIACINVPQRGFLLEVKGNPQMKSGPMAMTSQKDVKTARLWHRRLAHTGYENVARTAKCTKGMGDVKQPQIEPCDTCELAKSIRATLKTLHPRAEKSLYRLHVDLCFLRPSTADKIFYLCLLTDDKSRYKKEALLTTKDGAYSFVRNEVGRIRQQTGVSPTFIRRDAGGEFNDYPLRQLSANSGITYEITPPYGHEQAGLHERANRVVLDKGRAIIAFWDDFTPGDNRPDVAHLRTIGCKCFVHIEPELRVKSDKLTAHAFEGILIGFVGKHIYRVFNPTNNKVIITPHVVFHEEDGIDQGEHIQHSRPKGAIRRKKEDFDLVMAAQSQEYPDPPTLQDALAQPDGHLWEEATTDEILNLLTKDAIRFAKKSAVPKGHRLLTMKWVT